ncbi:MAG: hypothetical protein ABI315_01500 [Bacteroidia bacterium]
MEKQMIKKEIIELINRIKEQSTTLENMDRVPQPDVMLMLHKIQELQKKFIIFEHLNATVETTKPPAENIIVTPPPPQIIKSDVIATPPEVKPIPPPLPKLEEKKAASIDIYLMKQEVTTNEDGKKMGVINLSTVIGINDRFQFASELFDGNMQEYTIAIQQLSASETIESALIYFNNLQQLYNWDEENKTVQRLLALLNKNANK